MLGLQWEKITNTVYPHKDYKKHIFLFSDSFNYNTLKYLMYSHRNAMCITMVITWDGLSSDQKLEKTDENIAWSIAVVESTQPH